jgi:hypothetical protein
MLTLRDVLVGLVLPALAGAAMFFGSWRRPRPGSAEKTGNDASAAVPFALAVGYVVGDTGLFGTPRFPPGEAVHWLPGAAILMGILPLVLRLVWGKPPATLVAVGLVFAATIYAMAKPFVEFSWSTGESVVWLAGTWIAAMALTLGLAAAMKNERGVLIPTGLVVVLGLGAAVVMMSGSQTIGQRAGMLPATLAPLVVLGILFHTNITGSEVAPMLVLLFGGLLLCTHWFSELTALNAVLLLLAPLGAWIVKIPAVRSLRNWQRALVTTTTMAIPAAIAFSLALSKFLADIAEPSGYSS